MVFCYRYIFLHESGILGASPDGISPDATLEIKCPYKHRLVKDLRSVLVPKEKYIIWYDDATRKYVVNTKHHYYDQIQAQMFFSRREFSFLFIWVVNCHAVVRIDRDPSWETNISLLLHFYVDTFIPHLLENKDLNCESDDSEDSSSEEE